jgi:hypothetical protein
MRKHLQKGILLMVRGMARFVDDNVHPADVLCRACDVRAIAHIALNKGKPWMVEAREIRDVEPEDVFFRLVIQPHPNRR